MTLRQLHRKISSLLNENEIENADFEARLITEKVSSLSYSHLILRYGDEASAELYSQAATLAKRRIDGEPIQYILGQWDFMGNTFNVGKGVLIPRPETEILCEYVIDKLKNKSEAVIYDLCSGSGCIGISIKKALTRPQVYLVEKSEAALEYLKRNSAENCQGDEPHIIEGDVLCYEDFSALPPADVIISNPPYIKSSEIPTLQREVLLEPSMALDGGEDGLIFYRYLVSHWTKSLKKDGFIIFECGENQSRDIITMFNKIDFDSEVVFDYNNIDRIVVGRRK